jgi:DNA-binding FadR family transcriptional regulator
MTGRGRPRPGTAACAPWSTRGVAEGPEATGAAAGPERRRYLDVADHILRAVTAGAITRGDRLPNERELAARCGVSRSSVREALLALELGGVIAGRAGSGWYLTGVGVPSAALVAPPLDSSPRDLLEVRRIIDPPAVHASAWRIEPPDVRRLAALIDEAERLSDDPPGEGLHPFVRLNLAFHRELAQLCGNAILASVTSHLVDANEHPLWLLVDSLVVRSPATRAAQIREHRRILAAVAEHRGDDAAKAMAAHLGALTKRIFGTTRLQQPREPQQAPPELA